MSNNKSITFPKSAIALPVNGADISMFERLSLLQRELGWKCKAIGIAPGKNINGILSVL